MEMEHAIELPIDECNITVKVGRDGVWMHFTDAEGRLASVHIYNCLGNRNGIIGSTIAAWVEEREEQARQNAKDNGQFGVGS